MRKGVETMNTRDSETVWMAVTIGRVADDGALTSDSNGKKRDENIYLGH